MALLIIYSDGPQILTTENKIAALSYLNNLTAEVQSEIDPWDDICKALESEYIGQMIVLSAWKPSTITASANQPCVGINMETLKKLFMNIINLLEANLQLDLW